MWKLNSSKSTGGIHTSCFAITFMRFVHSASFSLLWRPTSVLRDEWRENSSFQKVPETTHTSCFIMILMSPVHSASLGFVGCAICFRIILIYLVHSSSFSLIRLQTNTLHLQSLDKSKVARHSWSRRFCENFAIGSAIWKFTPCTTQDEVSPSRWHENLILQKVLETTHTSCFEINFMYFWKFLEVWVLHEGKEVFAVMSDVRTHFLESGRDNSHLLFYDDDYDDYDVSCTFSKFNSCRTHDQFSPLWVTGELLFMMNLMPSDRRTQLCRKCSR